MRKITLGTLNISDNGKKYVNNCLNENRLSRGFYTEKFERDFAAAHGCKHAIFMNSGTSALQVALAALKEKYDFKDGDEVIVPATTFIATSNIVLQNNLKPVFVDVDPDTFNMDMNKLWDAITPRTRCIIPVHLFGLPADMTYLKIVLNAEGRLDIRILEDSCETMFAKQAGRSVGGLGDLACFSTYIAHLIVGGVGGLVTTNDDRLADLCRSFMAHGRHISYNNIDDDNDVSDEKLKDIVERRYQFDRVGYSYRATELEAAIALSEMEKAEINILTRQDNACYLTSLLHDLYPSLQLPYIPKRSQHSFMMYPMVAEKWVDREDLLMYLETRGIETRHMFPLLEQPIYRKLFPGHEFDFPVAHNLAKQGFFIGMHQGLTFEDMDYISDVLHSYFKERA